MVVAKLQQLRPFLSAILVGLLLLSGLQILETVVAPAASAGTVMNLDAPVVTSVISPAANQLTVNWTAPTNPSSLAITAYQVDYSTDGTTWTTSSSAIAANETSYTIPSGLTPNTKYYVRVAAYAGGLGSWGYPWLKIYGTVNTNRNASQQIVYESGYGLGGSDAAANNASTPYSRIRYRMQATYGGVANYVDANFYKTVTSLGTGSESFTTASNLSYLRIPTSDGVSANQFEIQGDVSDLTVLSNVSGVDNGSNYSGRLEIWPWNYDLQANSGLSTALASNSASAYDDGDSWNSAGQYGSFQLHRLSATVASRKTIFAWNNIANGSAAEIGFGNQVGGSGHPDWTFCSSNGTCASRTSFSLGIYINAPTSTLNSVSISYALNGGSGATPSAASVLPNTSTTLASYSGTKAGYNFAGWSDGSTTRAAGAPYTSPYTDVTMTAVWTNAMVLDYDVTDTASYASGTTLTNRSSALPNATLSTSGIYNRTSQSLEFSGGTYGTVSNSPAPINGTTFATGLTLDIYGSLGSDNSSSWERFIDFGHTKLAGGADNSFNIQAGRLSNTNRIQFEIYNQTSGTSSIGQCTSAADQLDATIHRYTFVLTGTKCQLFVDGTQVNVVLSQSNNNVGTSATEIDYGLPIAGTLDVANIAKSNWGADAATSGKIRSIRLLNNASTPSVIDQIDSGRLVYKTVSYSSPETATLAASDVTTGTLTLPIASTATRAGYSLNNWFTTNVRNVSAAAPGVGYLVPATTTLYAGWAGSSNSVSWDVQGGTPSIAGTTFVTGGAIAAAPASSPTRNDYIFAGWSATNGGTALTFPYNPPELTNITLYAKWTLLTTNQAALAVSSTSGAYGTALALTTSGGSGIGAVSYTVTNGTATGCQITAGSLVSTSFGTCLVTAFKASDSTYLSYTTSATTVTLAKKSVSVTTGSQTINFGGTVTGSYSSGALAGSDAISGVTYTYTGTGGTTYGPSTTAPSNAGTYSVVVAVSSMSTGSPTNYNFGYSAGTLSISAITLAAPATVTATTNTGTAKSLSLTWGLVANAANYTVKVSNGGVQLFTVDLSGGSATLTDSRLADGTQYDITVRANGSGNYSSSGFSSAVASAATVSAFTITYVYNGADGGNSHVTDSYISGGTAITLPTPTQTNFSFAGWYSDAGFITSVTGAQSPSSSFSLYAKWTQTAYAITYNPNFGVAATSVTSVTMGNQTVLPTPARANFVFDAWYTASTGGSKIGNAGASYLPTQTRTLYARWIQASIYGISSGNLSRIGTLTANDIVSSTYNGTLGGNSVAITLPSASLPSGTIVALDLITDTSYAQSLLSGTNSYILSIAVSWLAPDETVPNTNAGKYVQMVINNPSIKAGALVFSIQTGVVALLGTATVDGSITVQLTSDPSVYVVSTVPNAPQTVSVTATTSSAVVSWLAPSSNGGDAITSYTVTLNTGATCTTTLLTCTFNSLSAGTSYTATVIATNTIGNSASANTTFNSTSAGGGGGGVQPTIPITPIKPIVPELPKTPVTPEKPVVIPLPIIEIVESVSANNVPVLTGEKLIKPILFAADSAIISNAGIAALKTLIESIKGQAGTILVTGFVKLTAATSASMKKLATQRAKTVSVQLAKLGIAVKIGYLGYGPNNKVKPTPADRKVELRWVPATK